MTDTERYELMQLLARWRLRAARMQSVPETAREVELCAAELGTLLIQLDTHRPKGEP